MRRRGAIYKKGAKLTFNLKRGKPFTMHQKIGNTVRKYK